MAVGAGRDFERLLRAARALNSPASARGGCCTIGSMGREGLAPVLIASLAAPATACSLLVDTDVGVRAGGGAGAACGTVGRLQDDFASDQLSGRWEPYRVGSYVGVAEPVGGALRISFLGGVPAGANQISQIDSQFAYDLVAESVTVRADQVDDKWRSALVIHEPGSDGAAVGIGTMGPFMTAWTYAPASTPEPFASDPYDESRHRLWRIRESGDALEFETAGDDGRFAPFAHLDEPALALDNVRVALVVVSGDPSGEDGFIEFDDVNQGAVARPACPIADLADPFTTPAPASVWLDRSSGCTFETGDGRLLASAEAGMNCQLASAKGYSIEGGSALTVEIERFPGPGAAFLLHLTDARNHAVFFRQLEGTLRVELFDGSATVQDWEMPNDVVGQWWRVRESGGDLVMEISQDGTEFEPVNTFEPDGLIDLAETRAILTLQSTGEAASAEIGGVNEDP